MGAWECGGEEGFGVQEFVMRGESCVSERPGPLPALPIPAIWWTPASSASWSWTSASLPLPLAPSKPTGGGPSAC
jgi:hypothetical protein